MRCQSCHYELAHLTEHRCPECGRGFDPSNPGTFRLRHDLRWRWWTKALLSSVLAVLIVWLWWVNIVMHDQQMNGGWFSSPGCRVIIATAITCYEWWWPLIFAVAMYLMLSSVGWVQVMVWRRRARAAATG